MESMREVGMSKRFKKKADHSGDMVKRAIALAAPLKGLIAELYLIHARTCEENQKARRARKRPKK